MWSKREEINYSLQRRAALEGRHRSTRLFQEEICDADPMLIRAAKNHGKIVDLSCPICVKEQLLNLNYVFGEQLGQYSGRIKSDAELDEMQNEFGEFKVCVVEVCVKCGWNHMISSFLLGDGRRRRPPRRQKTVEDIYG